MRCSFTARFHNFIWFLIFTFTLYCMPNFELLFNYELHFGVPEAEAAEGGASASGAAAGETGPSVSFSVDDFSGSAHLSYPIAVPPARGGLAPQLSLGYNSSGGNGWIGVGWDLSVGCPPFPGVAYILLLCRAGANIVKVSSFFRVTEEHTGFDSVQFYYVKRIL
jgi:hypothetical protein